MKIIALFFPAFISVAVYCKRQDVNLESKLWLLVRYTIYTMFVNWCDMSLIIYVIKIDTVVSDSIESFRFFTKYVFIAIFFAWIIPYIEEIIKKYIHVKFWVEAKTEKVDGCAQEG